MSSDFIDAINDSTSIESHNEYEAEEYYVCYYNQQY